MKTSAKCPICGKPIVAAYRPFCSKRCADVDLNRWLSGSYAVPGNDDDSEGVTDGGSDPDNKPLAH
ncbi:MAG: DNA gyrase inhibitor YacG [Pseudomonadota bacterium]